jgi:transposase-like protein
MSKISSVADAMAVWEKRSRQWDAALQSGEKAHPNIARAVFQATGFVLRCYHHRVNWANGEPKEHLPRQIARIIAMQVAYIAAGYVPQTIRDCIAANRTPVGPQELDDICAAVLYRKAVGSGLIEDRSPIATVAREFGVSRGTVMRWNRQYRAVSLEEGLRHITRSEAPAHIMSGMRKSGNRYHRRGRSSATIASRNRKGAPG